MTLSRAFAIVAPLALTAVAQAQQARRAPAIAEVRIRITDADWARVAESGILTFPRQGLMAHASVVAVDTAGRAVSVGRLAPRWSTSDPKVVTTYGNPSDNPVGTSMGIVAQEDGRAAITVTVAGKTATLPIVVGKARQEIAASELTPKFRAARLEVTADVGNAGPEAEASASGVRLRENGHGVLLRPRATAADGTVIPVEHFPVTWSTSDDKVVELYQTSDTTTQTTSHDPGSATITATLQGLTVTVPVEVVKMGATVGPMRGPQLVGQSGGAIPVEKGEAAAGAPSSQAAPTSSSSRATTQTVTSAPAAPIQGTVAVLPRLVTTPTLTLVGRYMPDRTVAAPALALTGRYMPDRTITTPRLALTGTAPQ